MNRNSHTSLFLMEMIVSIFLFAIGSAVCIRVFTAAHIREKETKELEFATVQLQNITAELRNGDNLLMQDVINAVKKLYHGDETGIESYLSDGKINMRAGFDGDFKLSANEEYVLVLSLNENDGFRTADIEMKSLTEESEPILKTTVKCYIPGNCEKTGFGERQDRDE